eukprot:scaffold175316_cov13-Tisochrysis_lutea.AAC.1
MRGNSEKAAESGRWTRASDPFPPQQQCGPLPSREDAFSAGLVEERQQSRRGTARSLQLLEVSGVSLDSKSHLPPSASPRQARASHA